MKYSILLLIFIRAIFTLQAQEDCSIATATTVTEGNNIQAKINNGGNLFYGNPHSTFLPSPNSPHGNTIELNGFWFGGIDDGGNLRVAAQTYGGAGFDYDFTAGPLNGEGETEENTCQNWDRIWKIYRYQIEAHLADFADNGSINNPIPEIFNWPAKENGLFPLVEGFPLPESQQSLAPFHDENSNGIYDPLNGDFPLPAGVSPSEIPEEITYCIFNDNGHIHGETGGDPIELEIGRTTYSFLCEPDNPLNNTLFVSLQCTNKNEVAIDSFYFGQFIVYKIGCGQDDFIGSAPDLNAFYAYNGDEADGEIGSFCGPPDFGYGENPPAQGMIYLNTPLSKFMHVAQNQQNFGNLGSAFDYYKRLTGHWADNTPLTFGGNGYQTGAPTDFAFPGDPNDPSSWHMTEDLELIHPRTLSSTKIGRLEPGETFRVDLAHTYVHEMQSSNLENVTALFAQIEDVQALYDNQFENNCQQPAICNDDCVWTGDANADGITNHCDWLNVGLALNANETPRNTPHNWSPVASQDWSNNFLDGTNFKHADCDGNGIINLDEKDKILQNYGLINENYSPNDEYNEGTELAIVTNSSTPDLSNLVGGESMFLPVKLVENVPNLFGVAFSIEFDPAYFSSISVLSNTNSISIRSSNEYNNQNEEFQFATFSENPNIDLPLGTFFTIAISVKEEIIGNSPNLISQLRFKNVKGINNLGESIEIGSASLDFTFTNINATREASQNGFQIYPNPTTDILNIQFPNQTLDDIQIINVNGQIVCQKQARFIGETTLNLAHLPTGIYFLKMKQAENIFFQKIIKN